MYTSTLVTLALMGVASTQSTVSLFLPGFDQQALEASIVGSQSALTTYAVQCAATVTDSTECGIASALTITQGASTVHFHYGADDGLGENETIDLACQITNSKTAACTGSDVGNIGSTAISSVQTSTITDADQYYIAVVITAGAGASAANTAASTTATGSSSSGLTTKTSSSGSATVTGSSSTAAVTGGSKSSTKSAASGSSSASSSTSTGGMPMVTLGTAWAFGGAACAIAMAAM